MAHLPKGQGVVPMPPFMDWLATNIPAVYDNTMSYYDELTSLIKYLQDTVIPALNADSDAITVISNAVEQLQSYVEHYFDNLDVQEEINNKLDQMAQDGTLQEIITEYLQSNVAWVFNTVADMKASTNLIAGSYAQTLGFHSLNDGGGALYLITDTGTADEKSVIAVGDLYANVVVSDRVNVKQFGAKGDGTTDDSSSIYTAITYAKAGDTIVFPKATYLCNIVCTKSVNFDFQGSTLVSKTSSSILALNGTKSISGYLISSALIRGDKTVTIQQITPITLQAGDYILLRDDTLRPGDDLDNINEEVHQIEAISGNVITLKDFVRFPKAVATDTANIYKLDLLKDVTVKNVKVYDDSHNSNGVICSYCGNVVLENIEAEHMTKPAISFVSCAGVKLTRFNIGEAASTTSGNGYSVLLDHGTTNFYIADGCGDKQRHVIDCSSSFEGVVERVNATNPLFASFVLAHNSFGSDITFRNCTSSGGDHYGFVFLNQGVSYYYDAIAYNYNIIDCVVNLEVASVNSIGCFFQCPAQDCTIDNFTVKGKTQNSYGVGIRLQPINNRIIVTNSKISKVNRAVTIEETAVAEADNVYYVKFINMAIENCNYGFRIGNLKEIYIDRIRTDHCNTLINFGAYDENKTNAMKFFNLTNGIYKNITNLFVFNNQNYEASTYIIGKITNNNLYTAQGNFLVNVVNNAKLAADMTALNLRLSTPEGIVITVKANAAVTAATDFLPKGFTVFQTVTIYNGGTNTITLPHSTDIQTITGSNYDLAAATSTKYLWTGVAWRQIA